METLRTNHSIPIGSKKERKKKKKARGPVFWLDSVHHRQQNHQQQTYSFVIDILGSGSHSAIGTDVGT